MSARQRPVRVVHLCAVDFTVRQFIAPLALALENAGYDVRCACTRGPHWEELRQMGVNMVEMPIARSANPLRAAKSVWRLYKWLRRDKPRILHVHTPVASMIGRLAGWMARVPVVVYTAHGFYFHENMPKRQHCLHVLLEKFFGRFTGYLFCVSAEDARAARRLKLARRGRIFFTPNGADPNRFHDAAISSEKKTALRETLNIPRHAPVISIMGRLVREKGYAEFFQAAAELAKRHPNLHFLVIGDTVVSEHDDAKAAILRQAARLGERVHFTGLRRDIPELLAISSVFCLPSHREGMPVSIIEAMLMGAPVVATRIRGSRELIRDGEDGLLVAPRSAAELEDALEYMIENPAIARKLAGSAYRRARTLYDERKTLARQVRLYNAIAKRHLQ